MKIFYGLSNNVLHVLGLSYFDENLQLEIRQVILYMLCVQVMEGLLSMESEFSDHPFYRNYLFSHIS